jgi:hypothetical protein
VAKRACVLGAGVHVGQARDFVFVEVAPACPCGQPLSYAVPLVCCGLFELPPVLLRRFLGGHVCERSRWRGCDGAVLVEPGGGLSPKLLCI